jgi:5-formaminoimidazole-4-carboxamide-1-beta-D-ribofuranosyl 5'-monophosphate synthetase
LGQTLAIEIGERKINVMLNDVGSNYDFTFDSLRDADLELIESSQLVAVYDWGTNVVGGTDLAVKTFEYANQYTSRRILTQRIRALALTNFQSSLKASSLTKTLTY